MGGDLIYRDAGDHRQARDDGALSGGREVRTDFCGVSREDSGPRGARRSVVYLRRHERKYDLESSLALDLRQLVGKRLPLYSFVPGQRDSYITTVYFDTRNRDLYHRAERCFDNNFKIRLKEYYHPQANGEAAGSVRFEFSRFCFVEIKQCRDGVVFKRRFRLPKDQVAPLFAGKDVSSSAFEGLTGKVRHSVERTYEALTRYLQRVTVEVSSLVSYRRLVYQESESELRITFDRDVTIHAPLPALYGAAPALTPDVLGPPIRTLDREIMEIKCSGEYPEWLESALSQLPPRRLSKFTSSVRLVMESDSRIENSRPSGETDGPAGN